MTEKAKNVLGLMEIDGFENVRYISINKGINGFEPWFVAKDVAEALGYTKHRRMYEMIDKKDKFEINPQNIESENYILSSELTQSDSGENLDRRFSGRSEKDVKIHAFEPNPKVYHLMLINEPALYQVIFSSKIPAARQFQDVVFREVLPSIRKYGYYISPKKLAEMEEKKQDIRNLAAEARHSMLLRKGVKYPDWFDADEGFVQWKEQMKQGLQEIAAADGLKNHMAAFKAVKDKIWDQERVSPTGSIIAFCNHQLTNIECYTDKLPTAEDYEIFNPEKINALYPIYADIKLRNIFSNYVINGMYTALKKMPTSKNYAFREVDCGWY